MSALDSPFEGTLVRLRAPEPGDEQHSYLWANDPEFTTFVSQRYPRSHRTEREFVESHGRGDYRNAHFTIVTRAEEALIGRCTLEDGDPENRSASLGIGIGEKQYWNRGYGTDATRLLCRFGFEQMNLHRIELRVFADNTRAQRVYEKVGFKVEGRLREADYRYGRHRDIVVMGLLHNDFEHDHSPSSVAARTPGDGK